MAPTQLTETQKRDLVILRKTRNPPTEEVRDTQSETYLLVIDEPLEPTPINSEEENGEELNYIQI